MQAYSVLFYILFHLAQINMSRKNHKILKQNH